MRYTSNSKKLKDIIKKTDLSEYKSIPFWSWNGSLDEEELKRQIDEMHSAGMGGFIMHARAGLATEYLGKKWFSCVGACLKKAKELGMKAWLYDENGYPSGFAGGKLLVNEEFRAQYLEYEIKNYFDELAFASFVLIDGCYQRIYKKTENINEYHCVYLRTSLTTTDILDPKVVDAFICETHEKYYERFAESFGNELEGFFTDEPQYFRQKTPWSKILVSEFEKTDFSLIDGLIYLFVNDEKGYCFRTEYYKTLNRLYTENYYKKIYDWCTEHRIKLTGHSVEENKLSTQMWCCAGVMPSYEFEHIPGIDCLYKKNMLELAPKQVASVSAQLGKRIVLTETFAGCGNSVTLRELKSIAESQYFHGVNKMCQHLFAYSVAKQGKYDFPPSFSRHAGWLSELKEFNDYFTKLGFIIANTKEKCSVAIIHPIRSVYLDYIRSLDHDSVEEIEKDFNDLILILRKTGVSYHFVDETILEKYGAANGQFLSIGECLYDTVIIPKIKSIAQTTLNVLKEYKGRLCILGNIDYVDGCKKENGLMSNVKLTEIIDNNILKFSCADGNTFVTRRIGEEIGEFIFLKNLSNKNSSVSILNGLSKSFVGINIDSLETFGVEDEIELEPNGSLVLIKEECAKSIQRKTIENVTDSFKVDRTTENYLLLDNISYSKDGKSFSSPRYCHAVFDELLREDYRGELFVRQTFIINDANLKISLLMEKGDYASLTLNGNKIICKQSSFDIGFIESDLTGLSVKGINTLEYSINYYQHDGVQFALFDPRATENMRNCLYYDSSIEPVYIKGDFVVEDDYSISNKNYRSIGFSSLINNGYPFFFGEIEYVGEYIYDGNGDVEILIDGNYLAVKVSINQRNKSVLLENKTDISKLLICGKNQIRLTVKYGLRNFFGPHHYDANEEPWAVYPEKFTFRRLWNGDVAENFTNSYKLFPYGIEKIKIIRKQ